MRFEVKGLVFLAADIFTHSSYFCVLCQSDVNEKNCGFVVVQVLFELNTVWKTSDNNDKMDFATVKLFQ